MIPLGILASVADVPDYNLIETILVPSNVSAINFSNLAAQASNYRHLQIRYTCRSDHALTSNNLGIRFNNDSGTNYAYHALEAGYSGSSVISGAAANSNKGLLAVSTGGATTANSFAAGVIDILDAFSTSKNKTVRSLSGNQSNDSVVALRSALWMSTSSITSITIDSWMTANIVPGSRFSLYGIKG